MSLRVHSPTCPAFKLHHHPTIFVFLTALFLVLSLPSSAQANLSYSSCTAATDCLSPRLCSLPDDTPCPNSSSSTCQCRPPKPIACTDSTPCPPGERCSLISGQPLCASCVANVPVLDSKCITISTSTFVGGFAGDACDIAGPRLCSAEYQCLRHNAGDNVVCPQDATDCTCRAVDDVICRASSDCLLGELCVTRTKESSLQVCRGCTIAQTDGLTGVDEGRCLTATSTPSVPSPTTTTASIPTVSPSSSITASTTTNTPAPSTPAIYEGGHTFDKCAPNSPCRDGLQCLALLTDGRSIPCRDEGLTCQCGGQVINCKDGTSTCTRGDRCAQLASGDAYCVGCELAQGAAWTPKGDDSSCIRIKVSPSPTMLPSPSKMVSTGPTSPPDSDTPTESTMPDEPKPSDMPDGQSPDGTGSPGSPDSTPSTSTSASAIPSSSATGEIVDAGICIDASLLSHLSRDELVFKNHRQADVFCDKNGSCATGGHIVVIDNQAMSMKSYCALQEGRCVTERRLVNSPRMKRAMRVASHTKGLEFTALAARWGSVTEEMVLTTLVRLGV